MAKKAIVIGATGLIGTSLVDQLACSDQIENVCTLTRRHVRYDSPKIINHVVDFDHLEKDVSLFNGDLLFSCLGTTRRKAGSIEAQRRVDLEYQFKAAQLAADHGVGHYLLVSSSGANENSRNPYLKMKGELEQRILSLAFKRISIFQPSLLLGKRDEWRLGEILGAWILPVLGFIPWLRTYRPIPGTTVAKKMVQVSLTPGTSPQWFRLDTIF